MFGIFYSIINLIFNCIGGIKHNSENQYCKQYYKNDKYGTYIDREGKIRLLKNNKQVVVLYNDNGDRIHVYENGEKINISRQLRRNDKSGKVISMGNNTYNNDKIIGTRWLDTKNHNIYVIRNINEKYFYMNIRTALLEKPTENQILIEERRKQNNLSYHTSDYFIKFINKINKDKEKYLLDETKQKLPIHVCEYAYFLNAECSNIDINIEKWNDWLINKIYDKEINI